MIQNLGDYPVNSVLDLRWNTFDAAGASVTRATNGSIRIYKDNSATERTSSSGITDTEDFDSVTGVHHLRIDLSDNTHAGFYAAGSTYHVYIVGAVIDGSTVNACLARFTIEFPNAALDLIQGVSATTDVGLVRNTAYTGFPFVMKLSIDHVSPATGLTDASFSIKQYNLGAGWLTLSGTITEQGNGFYQIDFLAAELNAVFVSMRFGASACDLTEFTVKTTAA